MTIRIAAAVSIKARPGEIDVAFIFRLWRVIDDDARLIFKRYDAVHMIYSGHRFIPRQPTIDGRLDEHSTLGTRRTRDANANKRKMNVISSAVVAEINCIVTLRKPFRVSHRYR